MSFYLQPHTQPAPGIQGVAHLRLSKLIDHSTLKNAFLGDVQLSRPAQWLEDWDITSQNNGVYPVAAARSKGSSPASQGALSLLHLPSPVVIPSAFNAMLKLYCLPTVLHFIPSLTYIIVAATLLSACLHYAKKDSTFQRIFCLASVQHLHDLKSQVHVGPNASLHPHYIYTP